MRKIEEVQKEYTQWMVRLGEAEYRSRMAEEETNFITGHLKTLNQEAAKISGPKAVPATEAASEQTPAAETAPATEEVTSGQAS